VQLNHVDSRIVSIAEPHLEMAPAANAVFQLDSAVAGFARIRAASIFPEVWRFQLRRQS
jgi:hypothetical protein